MLIPLLFLAGCGQKAPPTPPDADPAPTEQAAEVAADDDLNEDAVRGATDPALRQLLHDHWEAAMKGSPVWATTLGDHRFDDRLPDLTPEGKMRGMAQDRLFLSRAQELDGLNPADAVTRDLLVTQLQNSIATDEHCRTELWQISPRSNALSEVHWIAESHPKETVEDGENLLARYEQITSWIDAQLANLERGRAEGWTPNGRSLTLTVEMIETQLGKDRDEWPILDPALGDMVDEDARAVFRTSLETLVESEVAPALQRYLEALKGLQPDARGPDEAGIWALPEGDACYAALVSKYTTLDSATADERHQTGLAELDRIHGEMKTLGQELYGTDDLAAIFERLRTDPELRFETAEEVEEKAASALAKAKEAMPRAFGRLPEADCVVERVPEFEAPYTTIAYYREPVPDGSRPGTYFINVYEPETRPRHEAEVLAFHESIPGHHLQIAISQELSELPAFRRHMGMTAFVEGWALYTEQLADELGLYSGPTDRMGMYAFETWRASRLAVDTGIHTKKWTREQAEQFMLENTPLAENNIVNEVDRYISWPGQALAYKTGQLEIWRLRREAEAELGDDFDLKGFHDTVLGSGAVTLPILESQVNAWVEAQ